MTKKKYILASYKNVFENMEDLSAELVRRVESGANLRDLVIGTYIGIPEISTNIAVNVGGKVKRMNKSSIKLEMKQPANRPVVEEDEAEPVEAPVEASVMEDSDSEENDGVCSFCGEKWIKKTVVEGFDTFLCKFHLQLESQLATL